MKTLFVLLFCGAAVCSAGVDFHHDVAPVLRQYCAGCHNHDEAEGDLSLESFASLLEGGESGDAIVPGKPDDSLLLQTVLKLTKPKMPPRKEPQPSPDHIDTLRQWIADGAPGPADPNHSILAELSVPVIAAAASFREPITALQASPKPGRERLAIGRFGAVELGPWRLGDLPGKVNDLAFSADGSLLAAATGITGLRGMAQLWDATSGHRLAQFGGHNDILYAVAFSPDGSLLATAGYDRDIKLWNLGDTSLVRTFSGHNGAVYDLAFSPDGTALASASGDQSVKLWRVADGERLDTLGQPEGEQFAVVFTPDGRHVLSAGADKRIHLWRFLSKKKPAINPLLVSRFAHEDEVTQLVVRQGTAISASADGTVRTWSLPDLNLLGTVAQTAIPAALSDVGSAENTAAAIWVGRMDGRLERITPNASGPAETTLPPVPKILAKAPRGTPSPNETEPNDTPGSAQWIAESGELKGHIQIAGDADFYRFEAGQKRLVLEVDAARAKSPLDAKISVLFADGTPVLRTRLQAVRESWLTFRGKNSTTATDFRLHNWRRMELNELLYINGEVLKLWHYPRGPDSGFIVYPGRGNRRTYFDTSTRTHPLGQPAYIVEPLPPGAAPAANGLPVFPVYYENDDDAWQRHQRDAKLFFTPPAPGSYLVRIEDVRGKGGKDYKYTLRLREPQPDFSASLTPWKGGIAPGSGKEFRASVIREDGFEGPVRIEFGKLPEGFDSTGPVVIEAGQIFGEGAVYAEADAESPLGEKRSVKVFAVATIDGKEVRKPLKDLPGIFVGEKANLRVLLDEELVIAPGETVTTRLRLVRDGMKGAVSFGKEFAGRNMPHGVYVDNIGLNGLFLLDGQSERAFQITAAPWVKEAQVMAFINTGSGGGQASSPIRLTVRKKL